nr:MAG TPA_asm: hypothetical protein [Caudoviricetes sp.]DAP22622.1 MAG TPA: hypothetical protein [Caudoviricetes sp.]
MIAAKQMGMSEEEFLNSCPFFFSECFSYYLMMQQSGGEIDA